MELNINKTNDSLPKQITYKWRENNNNKLGVVGREANGGKEWVREKIVSKRGKSGEGDCGGG